jgi:hypothetical protein
MAASIFDVDPRFLVIQIFAGSGMLGAVLLGHAMLFRRLAIVAKARLSVVK